MGNPTSSIFTKIFLQHYEDEHIKTFIHKHSIAYYYRYVVHSKISYTMEKEHNDIINNIEITLTRTKNSLTYEIYRKPTTTDTTIRAIFNHSLQHKLTAFRSMIHRLNTILFSSENYNKGLNTIRNIAHNNGFNKKTIDRILRQNHNRQKPTPTTDTTNIIRSAFAYTGPLKHIITYLLRKEGRTTNYLQNQQQYMQHPT